MEQINGSGYNVEENIYQRDGTYVAYPLIISGADSQKMDIWNSILLDDINKILKIYSDYAFTQPPTEQDIFLPDNLHITYEIKRNDDRYLSIFYTADFFSPYAAYPTQLVYTTNIDMKNNIRLKLSDINITEQSLVDDLDSWELVTKNDENKEYTQAIQDYITGLGKAILRMGFASADIIGPDNYLGIYSYLTPNKIGISISVPNYLGDHIEFERAIPT
jgi:hypothetical protein